MWRSSRSPTTFLPRGLFGAPEETAENRKRNLHHNRPQQMGAPERAASLARTSPSGSLAYPPSKRVASWRCGSNAEDPAPRNSHRARRVAARSRDFILGILDGWMALSPMLWTRDSSGDS
jgi:hypothetical protein